MRKHIDKRRRLSNVENVIRYRYVIGNQQANFAIKT